MTAQSEFVEGLRILRDHFDAAIQPVEMANARIRGFVEVMAALTERGDTAALDPYPEGCWADVWCDVDDNYSPCDVEPTDDLGLCEEHAATLRALRP